VNNNIILRSVQHCTPSRGQNESITEPENNAAAKVEEQMQILERAEKQVGGDFVLSNRYL
jgi:hypothetical protein